MKINSSLQVAFGTKIRKLREENKLKQSAVAFGLGIEQGTYAKIEGGKIKVDLERIIQLSRFFNVHPKCFFDEYESSTYQISRDYSISMLLASLRDIKIVVSQLEEKIFNNSKTTIQ